MKPRNTKIFKERLQRLALACEMFGKIADEYFDRFCASIDEELSVEFRRILISAYTNEDGERIEEFANYVGEVGDFAFSINAVPFDFTDETSLMKSLEMFLDTYEANAYLRN